MQIFLTIKQIEDYFSTITYKKNDFPPFHMIKKALALVDNPENDLDFIHVTGTNGKGSTCNYISSFLTAHDVKTGLFTSPHIHTITERLRVDNQSIPEEDFIRIFNTLFPILYSACQLIQFEWLTVMALFYFKEVRVDVVVLEVGIGGLFDSTNVIPRKLAAVITNVDFDHQNMLGNTLIDITKQKAGIIGNKTDMVFIGRTEYPIVNETIEHVAATFGVKALSYNQDFSYDAMTQTIQIGADAFVISEGLATYQYENITLALAVVRHVLPTAFGRRLLTHLIDPTIQQCKIPIRFEQIQLNNKILIMDGAHNIPGVRKLIEALKDKFPNATYSFVFCAMSDKSYKEMITLLEAEGSVTLYDYHQIYQRALEIEEGSLEPVLSSIDQLEAYLNSSKTDITVFVGSIYFVSYIRDTFLSKVFYS